MGDKEEDELILLNEIFETLRKDAAEVVDLIVTGINWYWHIGRLLVILILPATGYFLGTYTSGNLYNIFWAGTFLVLCILGAPLYLYKNRKLKKKYREIIDFQKSMEG